MGMIENARNAKRLQEAAERVRMLGADQADLSAPEAMALMFLFMRFKHHDAGTQLGGWFQQRRIHDRAFAAEADAYARQMADLRISDFKMLKRPEAQSALDRLAPR